MQGRDHSPVGGCSATSPSHARTSCRGIYEHIRGRRDSCVRNAVKGSQDLITSTSTSKHMTNAMKDRARKLPLQNLWTKQTTILMLKMYLITGRSFPQPTFKQEGLTVNLSKRNSNTSTMLTLKVITCESPRPHLDLYHYVRIIVNMIRLWCKIYQIKEFNLGNLWIYYPSLDFLNLRILSGIRNPIEM